MYGSSPFGSAPYGASISAGGAVSSPITALLSGSTHTLLEHLMWLSPFNPITGVRKNLYLSHGASSSSSRGAWYRTDDGDTFPTGEDASHLLFSGYLAEPPNIESRILSGGEVNYSASTYGKCVIADPRRELRQWMGYQWKNAPARYLIGDPTWPLRSFAEVLRGVTTELEPGVINMTVGLQDVAAKLTSTDYQKKRYAGRGPCIRLDGATGYLSGAVTAPTNSMTIGIRIRSRAAITTDQHIAGWRNGLLAGARRLRTDAGNMIVWGVRDDSGNSYFVTAPSILSPYTWVDVWGVLDVAAMRIALYDGNNPDTPISSLAIAGIYTTALSALSVGRLPDAASNYLSADVDELTIWDHALTPTEIAQWTGQRPPAGTPGLVYQYSMTEATGTTAFESSGSGPNLALNGAATWVDSLTGGSELQGKRIPKGVGIRRKVSPVVVSSIDLIYQVAETYDHIAADILGPIVEDGGIRVWTLKGVYADPYAATPSIGEYMEIPSMGLMRLGSAPIRTLTVDVYLTAAIDLPSCITQVLVTDSVLDPITEFDAASCSSLPATLGVGVIAGLDAIKVDNVLAQLLQSVKGWRTPNSVGALSFGVVTPPELSTPTDYATGDDFVLDGISPSSTIAAARGAIIRYRPYSQTQQPTNANPTLNEATKFDLNQPYRAVSTPDNQQVLSSNPNADLATRDTVLDSDVDAQAQADLEAIWRSKDRRTDALLQSEQVPRFRPGQVISIQMDVLDYENGKNVLVSAVIRDGSSGNYSIEVIGEVLAVGGDTMLVGDNSGQALVGDGTGSGVVED